jgi:hypothetical protein
MMMYIAPRRLTPEEVDCTSQPNLAGETSEATTSECHIGDTPHSLDGASEKGNGVVALPPPGPTKQT